MRSLTKFMVTAAALFCLFGAMPATAASIPQEIEELKLDYEYKYNQYKQAIIDGKTSLVAQLGVQVKRAKEKYERAVEAFKPSEETKETTKKVTGGVKNTVKKVFNIGKGSESNASGHTSPNSKVLNGYGDRDIRIEGNNYCGQFAMSALMAGLGKTVDPQKVYSDTNPAGIFTAPTTITEYLNMNGVDAVSRQNASMEDIVAQIDAGYPVVTLVDAGGGSPHWVCIYGYECDSNGNVTSVEMRDSYWGTKSGHKMPINDFRKAWKAPLGDGFGSKFSGYKNVMIKVNGTKTPDSKPSAFNFNFATATEDNIAGGINDVVTGFKNFEITRLAGGAAKCVLGVPGAAIGVASTGLNTVSDKVFGWGKDTFSQSGLANKIAGGGAVVVGGAMKAASWVGKTAGNLLSGAASTVGNFINKLGYVFRQGKG